MREVEGRGQRGRGRETKGREREGREGLGGRGLLTLSRAIFHSSRMIRDFSDNLQPVHTYQSDLKRVSNLV